MKITAPKRRVPKRQLKVKIKASAARTASRNDDYEEDYYEEEPNMKLSHAFLVVLALHLLAVGGVFGFNAVKAKQGNKTPVAEAKVSLPEAVKKTETAPAPVATKTVERTVPQTAPPVAAANAQETHTVVPGDTLIKIANLYGTSVKALESANSLGPDSLIRVGQVLTIPEGDYIGVSHKSSTTPAPAVAKATPAVKPSAPATKTTAASSVAGSDFYVVEKGENPYSIAKKLNVSYKDLLAVNDIADPTKIQIGQKLKVPAKNP